MRRKGRNPYFDTIASFNATWRQRGRILQLDKENNKDVFINAMKCNESWMFPIECVPVYLPCQLGRGALIAVSEWTAKVRILGTIVAAA